MSVVFKFQLEKEPLQDQWLLSGFHSSWVLEWGPQFLLGFCLEAAFSPWLGGPLQHGSLLHGSANGEVNGERVQQEGSQIFCNVIIEVTYYHISHILPARSKSLGPFHPKGTPGGGDLWVPFTDRKASCGGEGIDPKLLCHDETLLESDGLSKIQHLRGFLPIGALTTNVLNVWSLTVRQAIRE